MEVLGSEIARPVSWLGCAVSRGSAGLGGGMVGSVAHGYLPIRNLRLRRGKRFGANLDSGAVRRSLVLDHHWWWSSNELRSRRVITASDNMWSIITLLAVAVVGHCPAAPGTTIGLTA